MNNTGIIIRKIFYYNMLHMAENGMSERIFVVAKKKRLLQYEQHWYNDTQNHLLQYARCG